MLHHKIVSKQCNNNCIYISDINKNSKSIIWTGDNNINKIVFSKNGSQLTFSTDSTLWYYNLKIISKAEKLKIPFADDFTGLHNPVPTFFSRKGKLLFFKIYKKQAIGNNSSNMPNIYSYLDGAFDMSAEPDEISYMCCYNTQNGEFIRIEHDNEEMGDISIDEEKILISKRQGSPGEYYWNIKSLLRDYIINIDNKKRENIKTNFGKNILSPNGNFVIGYYNFSGDIICSDLVDKVSRNLTLDLPIPLVDDIQESPRSQKSRSLKFIKFINHSKNVLVRDRYDLWLLSSKNIFSPINLTNGFGRKNHISFELLNHNEDFNKTKEIILTAFNETTKSSGFYKIRIGARRNPEFLSMGPYIYKDVQKIKIFGL